MPSTHQPFNILVVDDDEDDFFITSTLLNEIGQYRLNVSWCPSYKTALEKLKNGQYNVVFADYLLGAKTGVDLIEDAISNGIDTPIILLTGKGNIEIDKNAMERGAYDYLIKAEITSQSIERSLRYAFTRYQTLKALQKSEKKYRSMFENSKDAMFILNGHFEMVDINDISVQLIGQPNDAILNTNIFKLFKNETDIKNTIKKISEFNQLIDEEIEIETIDGRQHIGLLTLTSEKDIEGKIYYQGVFHDITEFRKAEQANLLGEKFEATQRFVRMLAHEVRNPLNNILLSIDCLYNTEEDDNKDTYIDVVKRNSLRINDLISQLLESFKMIDIELQKTNLNSILQEALVSVYDRLSLKGITLKKQVDELVTINADAEKLKLVLVNFFVNAIEAMEENKGILTIVILKKDSLVKIIIQDNGCGMNESQQQRLFEPYFTTKKTGMGLGLSAAMSIIRSHSATIEIESEVNKGTQFTINFPK